MDQEKTWVPHRLSSPASRERKSKFLLILSCSAFVLAKVNGVRDAYTFVSKPYNHIYDVISNSAELGQDKRWEKPEASSVHPPGEDLTEWGEELAVQWSAFPENSQTPLRILLVTTWQSHSSFSLGRQLPPAIISFNSQCLLIRNPSLQAAGRHTAFGSSKSVLSPCSWQWGLMCLLLFQST